MVEETVNCMLPYFYSYTVLTSMFLPTTRLHSNYFSGSGRARTGAMFVCVPLCGQQILNEMNFDLDV